MPAAKDGRVRNGIYLGHTGANIPTLQNVLITGNDIYLNGNPDQNQAGRGISASVNGDVTVVKNRVYQNASAGIYLGDTNLTLTSSFRRISSATTPAPVRRHHQRQRTGRTEHDLRGRPGNHRNGVEIGGGGPWTIQYNVFTFATNTDDTWRGFIRVNDSVQDGLLHSDFNTFYSAGPNRWKRSDGTVLSFSQWQSFGFDAHSANPQ